MAEFDDIRKDFNSSNDNLDDIRKDFETNSTPTIESKSTAPIPGSDTPEDYERTREFQNRSRLKEFLSDVASTYGKNVSEAYKGGQESLSTSLADIGGNRPASAVGKAAFGTAGMLASPLTGVVNTAGEILGKVTANPEFGERAAALPIGGLPIKAGTQSLKAAMPTNKAMKILTESIGEENLPEVVKRMEANPRLTIMDVSNPTLQKGQKLVVTPGAQQPLMEKFVKEQKDTAKQTVEKAYGELGAPVNVKEKLDQLKANARKVGTEQINPAIAGAKPVDLSNVISHIDNKLKPGVTSIISAGEALPSSAVQRRLAEIKSFISNDKSIMTDPQRLHNIQSALRIEGQGLLESAVGSERTLGREIMNVRGKIVDAIDQASGGKYKPALSNFRDESQVEDAFMKGADITSNRKGKLEDLPEFWDEWIGKAKPAELEAAKEGALTELRRQRAVVRNAALKGETVPEIEFNAQKLSSLFGKEKTQKLQQDLRDERDIAIRNQKLYENSQTAMRMKADEAIDLPEPHSNPLGLLPPALVEAGSIAYTGQPGLGLAAYGASKGTMWAVNKLRHNLAERKNVELTKLLTSSGEERQQMLEHFKEKIRQGQSPKGNLISRINALSNVIAP